jgi:acyl-CoA thioesterase-1
MPRVTRHLRDHLVAIACLVVVAGCTAREPSHEPARENPPAARAEVPPASTVSVAEPARPRIVVLGDSLTAGLGIDPTRAYPALLQQHLDAAGLGYQIVNAGVSGDTSAGGLSRLDWALDGDVRVLIVALGGNDALRGLPVDELRRNLTAIVERAQARHIKVMLAGMEAPPNFGPSYAVEFHQVYPALARKYGTSLVPFLLEGVAGIEALNQRDGIHPNVEGARLVADRVWSVLAPLLEGPTTSR